LLGAWLYSAFGRPLYLPGRYDTIVLPVFLMLLAIGVDKVMTLKPLLGGAVTAAIVALAGLSLFPALGAPVVDDPLDLAAGQVLAQVAAADDRIISTSLRQQVTAYYAQRAGFRGRLASFPSEITQHSGWYSAARLLGDRARLKADGERVARELIESARQGHTVWILASRPSEIDDYLFEPLLREMEFDDGRSHFDAAVLCLKLRERP
jgi:hypothetical protein